MSKRLNEVVVFEDDSVQLPAEGSEGFKSFNACGVSGIWEGYCVFELNCDYSQGSPCKRANTCSHFTPEYSDS